MRSVNVAELKNQLSKYLTFAKRGEEVVIRDRNLPVAKLVPFSAEGADDQELMLVAAGKLRLPKVRLDVKALLKIPTGSVAAKKNCEKNNRVLGCQRASSLVHSRSRESSRSVPSEEICARSLVGKSRRSSQCYLPPPSRQGDNRSRQIRCGGTTAF